VKEQPIRNRQGAVTFSFDHWLIVSCLFSYLLLCTRLVATGSLAYAFLLWNLVLALVPYMISRWLVSHWNSNRGQLAMGMAALAWLLFIPNSFYILTDLFHLGEIRSAPKWFDLLLIFSFAWNGLAFGITSIRDVEIFLQRSRVRRFSGLIVFGVMWLIALGIYVGRFLRYNSWDVITQPLSLLGEIFAMIFHPFANKMEWAMILIYALFMYLLYEGLKKLSGRFETPRPVNH
jgi:uncharacterized membrane protein